MLVGHQEVTEALSLELPPVSIITGPPSVGKRLIAAYSAIKHDVARVDFIQISRLTTQEVLKLKEFMSVTPYNRLRFALIDMDYSSKAAKDDLLNILEGPAIYARFSLISSNKLPMTLSTRGQKFNVGLLKPCDLAKVLESKGIAKSQIAKVDKLGRVDLALKACADISSRSTALNVLQAVEARDLDLFVQSYKAVDETSAKLVVSMLQEAAVGQFKLINPEYLGKFAERNTAMHFLNAWSKFSDARPSISVRVALESMMKG